MVVCLAGLCGDSFPVFSFSKQFVYVPSYLSCSHGITFYQLEVEELVNVENMALDFYQNNRKMT